MKYHPKLVEAMRSLSVKLLDSNFHHDWHISTICHCGLLTQELGLNPKLSCIDNEFVDFETSWTLRARIVAQPKCSVTGLGIQDLFNSLRAYGLEYEDFEEIEFLGDRSFEEWQPYSSYEFDWQTKEAASIYFKNKAEELERQHLIELQSSSEPAKIVQTVIG